MRHAKPWNHAALTTVAIAAATMLAACGKPADTATPAAAAPRPQSAAPADGQADRGIAWRHARSDADVDAAFAVARNEGKPVFVYWGAKWCPPCNQVKATLFNRQDFIERSRAFVPVHVDGDSPGAQKLGARFRVSGYPTMVLFNAKGEEVTRLPGEVEASRYNAVLDLGMNATRPVKTLVADALAGGERLSANDWRLLAWYSWDTDLQQVIGDEALPATLAKLAAACPPAQAETAMRLSLKSLAIADGKPAVADGKPAAAGGKPASEDGKPAAAEAATRDSVVAVLGDPARSREQADLVVNSAAAITRSLAPAPGADRDRIAKAFDAALLRLQADTTLSRADRMGALISRVDLARLDEKDTAAPAQPTKPSKADRKGKAQAPAAAPLRLPETLLADIRAESSRADREITDGYERQAVITAAGYLLERAGLSAESDALLEANLAKSHSPYYLMSGLASNARKRGDVPRALQWYGQAFEKSEGPATRLQWGASYLSALVDLTPADEPAIESAALAIWREAAAQPDAFHQRSSRSLERIGNKLAGWNEAGRHAAAMARLRGELKELCAAAAAERSDADRAGCVKMLDGKPAATKA